MGDGKSREDDFSFLKKNPPHLERKLASNYSCFIYRKITTFQKKSLTWKVFPSFVYNLFFEFYVSLGLFTLPFNMVSNTPIECILDREHPSYLNLSVTERRPQVIIMGLRCGHWQYATIGIYAGFFLTSAAEKTKTQGQNSSRKLKEKTQSHGVIFLLYKELKKKKLIF